jgi:hypothetical protein
VLHVALGSFLSLHSMALQVKCPKMWYHPVWQTNAFPAFCVERIICYETELDPILTVVGKLYILYISCYFILINCFAERNDARAAKAYHAQELLAQCRPERIANLKRLFIYAGTCMASAFSPPTSHHNHATHIASLHSERSISSSCKDQHPENIVSVLTKASNDNIQVCLDASAAKRQRWVLGNYWRT